VILGSAYRVSVDNYEVPRGATSDPRTRCRMKNGTTRYLPRTRSPAVKEEGELAETKAQTVDQGHDGRDQPSEVVIHREAEALPNESRLSCGRNTRRRKEVEAQRKRLAGEATQVFPTCERPAASSAC